MQVKMLENVQGRDIKGVMLHDELEVSILTEGDEFRVDAELGKWLLENHKAVELVKEEVKQNELHYGAQPEPEPRHDDEVFEVMTSKKRGRK